MLLDNLHINCISNILLHLGHLLGKVQRLATFPHILLQKKGYTIEPVELCGGGGLWFPNCNTSSSVCLFFHDLVGYLPNVCDDRRQKHTADIIIMKKIFLKKHYIGI